MEGIRIQKYLADAGVASRRKAEELVSQGRVAVDGIIVTEQGVKITGHEKITVDGALITPEDKKVYIALNKPAGYVSTVKDQFARKTVIDLVEDVGVRVFPVGRLDYDTTGLLLLTNDGELTFKLTHPAHEVNKTYEARVKGIPGKEALQKLGSGVEIEDYTTSAAEVKILQKMKEAAIVQVTIHEGRNRQVRKMLEAVGHPVTALKRVSIGGLTLNGLEEGKWRYLKPDEVKYLKSL